MSAQSNVTATVTVSDNLAVSGKLDYVNVATFDRNGPPINGNEVLRNDGLPWQSVGFTYDQTVYITGVGLRHVVAFDNSAYGDGSGLIFDGAPVTTALGISGTVSVTSRYRISGVFTPAGLGASGLAVGMQVVIEDLVLCRTLGFCDVHCYVGIPQHVVRRSAGVVGKGNADACGNEKRSTAEIESRFQ
jgi:hypothetical protein